MRERAKGADAMDYLVEVYDINGRCVYHWRTKDAYTALRELAQQCEVHLELNFHVASCYYLGDEVWLLEIK